MIGVDVADVFRAVWVFNMQGKKTFRATQIGVKGGSMNLISFALQNHAANIGK